MIYFYHKLLNFLPKIQNIYEILHNLSKMSMVSLIVTENSLLKKNDDSELNAPF